jgi:glutathionylspermidine synthase
LVLNREHWAAVASIARRLTQEALSLERELVARFKLHPELGLSRHICTILRDIPENPDGRSTRIIRFDFHYCSDGWRVSEVNSDVPGGFIESSGLTQYFAKHYPGLQPLGNPGSEYAKAIASLAGSGSRIALVHATAYSDDRQVMEYIARELRAQNLSATVVSPGHIRFENDRARIESRFASGSVDALIRFFPAEWLPRLGRRSRWSGFFFNRFTGLSNPGTAVVLQSKRVPLLWDDMTTTVDTWRSCMPESRDPGAIPFDERDQWVFKPTLGRVGEGVAMSGVTKAGDFDRVFHLARKHPIDWIAQRRFSCVPIETPDGLRYPCLGVFTVDGQPAGCYGRVSVTPLTDADSQDVAVLTNREDASGT